MGRLVINGDEIYELDEDCLKEKKAQEEKERRCQILEERKISKMKKFQEYTCCSEEKAKGQTKQNQ